MASPGGGSRALSAGTLWTSRSPTDSVGATLAVGKLNYEYPLVNENLGLPLPEALRARASRKQGRVVSCTALLAFPGPSPDPCRAPGAKLRACSLVDENVMPPERGASALAMARARA